MRRLLTALAALLLVAAWLLESVEDDMRLGLAADRPVRGSPGQAEPAELEAA